MPVEIKWIGHGLEPSGMGLSGGGSGRDRMASKDGHKGGDEALGSDRRCWRAISKESRVHVGVSVKIKGLWEVGEAASDPRSSWYRNCWDKISSEGGMPRIRVLGFAGGVCGSVRQRQRKKRRDSVRVTERFEEARGRRDATVCRFAGSRERRGFETTYKDAGLTESEVMRGSKQRISRGMKRALRVRA